MPRRLRCRSVTRGARAHDIAWLLAHDGATTIVTVDPSEAGVPGSGDCDVTTPAVPGWPVSTRSTTNPAVDSCAVAASADAPTTDGTSVGRHLCLRRGCGRRRGRHGGRRGRGRRRREVRRRRAGGGRGHELLPDGRGPGAAVDSDAGGGWRHRSLLVLGEAHPHGGRQRRRVAAEPRVLVVLSGPGLARRGTVELRAGPGATRDHLLEHRRHRVRHVRTHRLVLLVDVLVEHRAVRLRDARDHHRIDVDALVGQRAVHGCHLERLHVVRSEHSRGHRLERGRDAHLLGHVDRVLRTDLQHELREQRVVGVDGALDQVRAAGCALTGVGVVDRPRHVGARYRQADLGWRREHLGQAGCPGSTPLRARSA